MATGPFILTEQQVALRLGVAATWVREHRGEIGIDWSKDQGRVLWTEAGLARLNAILEHASRPSGSPQDGPERKSAPCILPGNENPPCGASALAAAEKNAAVTLTVARSGFINTRVLLARSAGSERLLTVWVTDSRRFQPGLSILARPWPGRPNVFTFAGNPENPAAGPREPRRKGVW